MMEELLEAWRTNNRINLFLIDRISEEGMRCTLSKRGGRDVVRQFAHLHNVRIYHLENRAKALAAGLTKFETQDRPDKETLKAALIASGERIEQFIAASVAGNARTFKKGIIPHIAYFIAHESHHRGSILLTLKECGHKVDQQTAYAIWDWDRM
jgi:uncharacterized damage-inducible protein DinB